MDPNDPIQLRQLTLEWKQFAVQQSVSAEMLAKSDLSVRQDYIYNALALQLRMYVLVDQFAHDTFAADLDVPANWWEHWKEQHGRKWLGPLIMRRWPVRYDTRRALIDVKRCLSYPEAKLARDPGGLGVVRILEQTNGPYWLPEARS